MMITTDEYFTEGLKPPTKDLQRPKDIYTEIISHHLQDLLGCDTAGGGGPAGACKFILHELVKVSAAWNEI